MAVSGHGHHARALCRLSRHRTAAHIASCAPAAPTATATADALRARWVDSSRFFEWRDSYVLKSMAALGVAVVPLMWATRQSGECQDSDTSEHLSSVRKIRVVLDYLRTTHEVDTHGSLKVARSVYKTIADQSGQLGADGVRTLLSNCGAADGVVVDLAHAIFRLLDENGDGNVSEQEFVIAHALVYAAAQAKECTDLAEHLFRALDSDRDGILSRDDVAVAVRLMLSVNAVRPQDRKETYAEIKRNHGKTRRLTRDRSEDNLVDYYMQMYDTDGDGRISKAEFGEHTALQESFFHLLTSPELDGLFKA